MAREKKQVHLGVTKEQMEEAFGKYAIADAKLKKIEATIDVKTTQVREQYAPEISQHTTDKDNAFDVMQAYALENRAELFSGKKKSIDSVHGTIGFRTGTPKLKTLKGFTWEAVANLLKVFLPDYVRTTCEPDKNKLLADRDNKEITASFPKVGVRVDQDETFYVEPKKEAE